VTELEKASAVQKRAHSTGDSTSSSLVSKQKYERFIMHPKKTLFLTVSNLQDTWTTGKGPVRFKPGSNYKVIIKIRSKKTVAFLKNKIQSMCIEHKMKYFFES